MAQIDPHQGGDLFDMARDGTTMPNDAGLMNVIPSKPRPGEGEGPTTLTNANGHNLAFAAENRRDIPRSYMDMGATGEVETGTGDQLPAGVEAKRIHYWANDPNSKGQHRTHKHLDQREPEIERFATEGGDVDFHAFEDMGDYVRDSTLDRIADSRERKDII